MISLRLAAAVCVASTVFGADPALLNLVSPNAKVIGGANVSRTMSSPFGQFLLSKMNADDPGFREFVSATGFDPRRDVREVVFASTGAGQGKHNGLVAARGVFNGPQILAAIKAKRKAPTTSNYKGIEVMQFDSGGALAVMDGSLLLAGQEDLVKHAIDRQALSALTPGPLFDKARSLMNRYDAWMVSAAPVSAFAGSAPHRQVGGAMRSNAMEAILETSGGVTFNSVVSIEGEALTRSEKDAQALADVVKFLTGMITLNREDPKIQQLEPILNALEVRTEASTVRFSLRVPEADLERLITPKRAVKRAAAR